MRKNVLIKKEDYERYNIPISVLNLFSKKKNNYLWEELEKRHPCFSNAFCYSARNYISKKGLFSDVVVMEKTKLAEYKNKCSFLGYLTLDDAKRRNVFKNKNINLIYVAAIIVFFILILSVLKLFIPNKIINYKEQPIYEDVVSETPEPKIETFKSYDKNILGIIFDITRKNNGKLTSLSWNINDLGEKVSCSFNNIYPEQLENIFPESKIPIVKYIDKKPILNFDFVNNFIIKESENQNESIASISMDVKQTIRKFFNENKIEVLEESTSPYGIVFELENDAKSDINILQQLGDLLYSLGIHTVRLSITPSEKSGENRSLHFNISFSNLHIYENNILNTISKNTDLFFDKNIKNDNYTVKKSHSFLQNSSSNKALDILPEEGIKVGEIEYGDGKKIIFYKENNGKIVKKEFCNENKM